MRLKLELVVLLATMAAASLLAATERQTLPGHVPSVVRQLAPLGEPNPQAELRLAVSLPLRDQAALQQLLEDLYNPASPQFRHYLTSAEFAARFGPSPEDYDAVARYCQAHGLRVTGRHANRTVLEVAGPVNAVEAAFHTRLRLYQHPREPRTFYAPESEPAIDLSVPVLHVQGLDNLNPPRALVRRAPQGQAAQARAHQGSGTGGAFLGSDFRAAYAPDVALTGTGQSLALVEFDGFYQEDITSYEQLAGLPAVPVQTVLLDHFSGVPTPGPNSGNSEVALDIQMAMAMAPGLSNVVAYEAAPNTAAITVLNRIATDNVAKQIACSWTWGTYDPGTDQVFQQMAAQGQSFFQASGDSGAYTGGIAAPADNPYVTVVGGTTLSTTDTGAWGGEMVWNDGLGDTSGGGVSTRYALPSWQGGLNMTFNLGSTANRNIPDVAMIADNVLSIGDNGQTNALVGTSIGAPLWAGFVALANEQAALNGQPPVGFINPAVYALGSSSHYLSAFHDVISGDNSTSGAGTGYPAVAGYDLSTGWGTPTGSATIGQLLQAAADQLDHFAWLPLNSVPTNAPFPVTVYAQTIFNTTLSSFTGTASLSLAQVQTNTVLARDFEDGVATDWANGGGPYQVLVATNTGAAGTTHSLTLIGGDTTASYNGVSHDLANVSPDVFEFYVKAQTAGTTCGYVVAGSAAYRTNAVFHFRMDSSGQMGLTDAAGNFYGAPFVAKQWYKIDLRLDWADRTLDYYANDSLVVARLPFCNTNLTSLAVMFLYNFDNTEAWWDQFSLLQSVRTPLALTPTSTTAFTQGFWTGNLTLAQGGTNLVLTATDNAGHSGASAAFTPGVQAAPAAPQIIGQPASQTVSAGGTVNFTVVAAGTPPLRYQWYSLIAGRPWKMAGKTNATLTLGPTTTNMTGGYYVTVANQVAPPNTVTSMVAQLSVVTFKTVLGVHISGNGTIAPNYAGQVLLVGKQYTVTAIPGPGYVFSGWDGGVTSGVPKLTFTMSSNLVLQVSFSPNPFFPVAGNYQGLFYDPNGLALDRAGFVSAAVTTHGTFSAKFRLGNKTYPLAGLLLGNNGTYAGSIARGTNPIAVSLQLDLGGQAGLTGQLGSGDWVAQLLAVRSPYNATANAAPQAGKYTLLLPGTGGTAEAPGGDSYATITVSPAGTVQWSGMLADGTRISQSTILSGKGEWPLFASLYSGNGLVLGWMTITNDPASDIDGVFAWVKAGGAKIDAGGLAFTNRVLGSLYRFTNGVPVLDVGTGQVSFASSALPQAFTNAVALGDNNKVLNLSATNRLTFSLTTSSGLFRGQATDPQNQGAIPFSGVVLQKQQFGAGFFLSTNQSGEVFLGPSPN